MIGFSALFRFFVVPAACAVLLAPASLAAKEYTEKSPLVLKMTTQVMPTHPMFKYGLAPWAEELKQKSGGRLVVEIYNPNTICPDGEVYDCLQSGVLDLAVHNTQRVKGVFPLSGVMDLPFLFSTAENATRAFIQLVNEYPDIQQEYKGIKRLGGWCGAPFQLNMVHKRVHTMEDLKGMKIGLTAASIVPIVNALGATSVVVPLQDCYLALQRGQVDTITVPYAFVISSKIYEATKYNTTINMFVGSTYMAINQYAYNSMPDDLRTIFDASVTPDRFLLFARVTDRGDTECLEILREAGQEVFVLPYEEILKGRELTRGVADEWIQDCARRGKGDVAKALYGRAVELANQYAAEQPLAPTN